MSKNRGGRPSKCTEEILEKAAAYLEEYEAEGHMIPSISGLSLYLGIPRRTIHRWAEQKWRTKLCHILEQISVKQRVVLLSKGLSGEFNSNITKLVLGKHGYHEKKDIGIGGNDGGPLTARVAARKEIVLPAQRHTA